MNRDEQWLLPEGVEELLPTSAAVIERQRRRLLDLYASWGYQLVFPPLIEFLDSLLNGAGRDLETETFKLTDQLSGRLMGVRADITPQVARLDAHSLRRESPSRLCYCSTALRTRASWPGGSRIPYQIGVELFGHAGMESDLEVISLLLETLKLVSAREVVLDLGHVGIFRALVEDAELNERDTTELTDILLRKAASELQAFLEQRGLTGSVADALSALPWLAGQPGDVLPRARQLLSALPEAAPALDELEALAAALSTGFPQVRLHLDLGELRGYHYHTGCLFAAYAEGCREPLAKGGRYDHIGEVFGRARPATGFSADLKLLTNGLDPAPQTGILAPALNEPGCAEQVARLRDAGERVVASLPGATQDPAELGCDRQLVNQAGRWQVVAIEHDPTSNK